jgi:hypothetical protein
MAIIIVNLTGITKVETGDHAKGKGAWRDVVKLFRTVQLSNIFQFHCQLFLVFIEAHIAQS